MNYIDNAKSYDLICDEWQKFRNSTAINNCIVDFVKYIPAFGHVLDIGCGTGYPIAQYLISKNFSVTGIDISREMISKAKNLHLPNAIFKNEDILNFSSDILFDGVIAFDSIWHIDKTKQAAVYRKISSLMKNGAYFIFTHGNHNGETVGTMFGQQFYYSALNVDELSDVLFNAGLKIITLIENYDEPTTGKRDLIAITQKQDKEQI